MIDPTFGVAITRLTDRGQGGGLATAEYPQLQAFNADETRILLVTEGGSRQVMDFATRQITHTGINLRLPRWSPIDQDTLYGFNRLSGGTIWLQSVELQPGGTFITTNLVNVTNLGYATIEEGCFEELSGDGRYMTLIDEPNAQVSVLDLSTGRLRSTVRPQADVDWVAVSESGRYLAIQYVPRGTGSAQGLAIYDASNGQLLGHAADHHDHGDLGLDAIGDEVYVTMGYTNGCAGGRVACYSVAPLPAALEQGARRDLFEMPPAVGSYTSCRNVLGPGFCLNGDDYASRAGSTPFARELWLTRLSDGAVKRLAHHRSSSCSYWNTARPTISRSGRYALFTSDWARPNCSDQSDLYVIDLTPVLGDWIAAPTPTPVDGGVAPDASTRGDASADAGTSADAGVRADAG
ncbi:hypothetical protein L6R52_16135, partial [Myxococcota bacterium]|nr:hypothetical protein [Myxococcota bacterium]